MNPSSDLALYYQILELTPDATEQEIKVAYRRLARRYHPDVNRSDRASEARFKQIAHAYQTLIKALEQMPKDSSSKSQSAPTDPVTPAKSDSSSTTPRKTTSGRVRFYVQHPQQSKKQSVESPPNLSPEERRLKISTLNQVYNLMKRKKWQQVIDLLESLAVRFPEDADICQWQALAYRNWARRLIDRKQYEPARAYLKKALQTDPHNHKLWNEVEQEYKRMERLLKL